MNISSSLTIYLTTITAGASRDAWRSSNDALLTVKWQCSQLFLNNGETIYAAKWQLLSGEWYCSQSDNAVFTVVWPQYTGPCRRGCRLGSTGPASCPSSTEGHWQLRGQSRLTCRSSSSAWMCLQTNHLSTVNISSTLLFCYFALLILSSLIFCNIFS